MCVLCYRDDLDECVCVCVCVCVCDVEIEGGRHQDSGPGFIFREPQSWSRMTSFDRAISSCGTLTSRACRSQKSHLDVTKYPLWDEWGICRRLSLSPTSLSPSPCPSHRLCTRPKQEGQGGLKLSIQVLMKPCYQLPAAPDRSDVGTQGQSSTLFPFWCVWERKQKGLHLCCCCCCCDGGSSHLSPVLTAWIASPLMSRWAQAC